MLNELKKLYDNKPFDEIQEQCNRYKALSADNRKDFILCLYYLQRTNRFRENPVYANSTFEKYISNTFNLRLSTYDKERVAFISHPKAATKWGAGLVDKVKTVCGSGKIADVFNEIESTNNITHSKIDKIIEKHAKPRKDKPVKETKKILETENSRNIKTIADYIRTIAEKDEQISKLKATVFARDNEILVLNAEIDALRAGSEILIKENESLKRSKNYSRDYMLNTFTEFLNGYSDQAIA